MIYVVSHLWPIRDSFSFLKSKVKFISRKMNREESRLRTFRNWPSNAPVDARRIAKAGFYYMGQNLEVQCFKCGGRISEWNYNDQVMARHRALDPRCPFVLSPALSGNIPITNNGDEILVNNNLEENSNLSNLSSRPNEIQDSAGPRLVQEDQMRDEQARLRTFSNWPVSFIVTPESLARAGFYYVQQGDKVRCAYCSVIIGRWERGDDPLEEHRRHSESCSFIQTLNFSVPDNSNASGITLRQGAGDCSESTMKSLGVQSHRVAKHPKYASKDSRLATFTTWPGDVVQSPDQLAEAGFYYAGSGDQVRCFHCNGGLRKWDPGDDPWVEHARWYPECGFLELIKGEKFISDCLRQHPPIMLEEATSARTRAPECRLHPVSEEDLERLMSSPEATAALQIGLDLSRVKTALRHRMERTGQPFLSPDDLIEATLDIQLDEVPYQDSEETWSTPLHSPIHRRVDRILQATIDQRREATSHDTSDSEEAESHHKQGTVAVKEKSPPPSVSMPDINTIGSDRKVTLEEENRRLREARLCKICMDSEVCIVFLPCGHLVTCVNCAHSLADCPVCRRTIKATVRTFLS